jgi:hypothetical protein
MTVFNTTSEAIRAGFEVYDCPQRHRPEWLVRIHTAQGYALAYALKDDTKSELHDLIAEFAPKVRPLILGRQ